MTDSQTWSGIFWKYIRKGCDQSDAALRADLWQKRTDRQASCTTTHCERGREEGYRAGKAEGLALLDKVWERIRANDGYVEPHDIEARGYVKALFVCLNIIQDLGGMDPRERENNG